MVVVVPVVVHRHLKGISTGAPRPPGIEAATLSYACCPVDAFHIYLSRSAEESGARRRTRLLNTLSAFALSYVPFLRTMCQLLRICHICLV